MASLLPDILFETSDLVGLVFGSQILEYTLGLCEGRFDYLERLSDKLLLKVLSYLSYQDICLLSQTSHRFRKLCDSRELWEQRCSDALTPDIEMLADRFGWKRVYATLYQTEAQSGGEPDSPMSIDEDKE
ncbi:F-box only protein 36 [Bagarius yarrelli]|uniref:F-box only protein 36 n=1 Tax=Bagarius yarrelli TaxID=175774 RepID=A0A556V1V6_BAGYA|nr:F-box only protein 36 [Bagarius yarrelli]